MELCGANMEPYGANMELCGADMEPYGASMELTWSKHGSSKDMLGCYYGGVRVLLWGVRVLL